ncbi:hypothetical protein EBU99_03740 [bacterium]|nr:hypothetical protein [bacterium]
MPTGHAVKLFWNRWLHATTGATLQAHAGCSIASFFFIFLSGCGDASQQYERTSRGAASIPQSTFESGHLKKRSASAVGQQSEYFPLASGFLVPLAQNSAAEFALDNINFSSQQGELPEHMMQTAEELGLVANAGGLGLASSTENLPNGWQWRPTNVQRELQLSGTHEGANSVLHEMQLEFNGIPVHHARVKAILDNGTTTWMTGSVPTWLRQSKNQPPKRTVFSLTPDEARIRAAQQLNFADWRFHSPERSFIADNQAMRAAFLFTVSAEPSAEGRGPALPLEVAIDADKGDVLWQRPLAMHANATLTGSSALFLENKGNSSVMKTVDLEGLITPGNKLSHDLFDIYNCQMYARALDPGNNSVCKGLAIGSNGAFSYAYDDQSYDEVVSYAAITRSMKWYRAIDRDSLRSDWDTRKWPGSRDNFGFQALGSNGGSERRLGVYVRTETSSSTTNRCGKDTTPDNAQYLWAGQSGRGNPEILIGYGGVATGCGSLRDLGKDEDVVMHEFGHHIVFRGLSNSKQQSVAMHEGFADYFTYAITGNNLLAEYSYPGRSALRQGNITPGTTFKTFKPRSGGGYYSVLDYVQYPHAVGEFWSGILWEARNSLGRDANNSYKMDKIVWDAIDLIKIDGELYDGIVALSESAKRYAQKSGEDPSSMQRTVQNVFLKYGFIQVGSSGEISPTDELAGGMSSGNSSSTVVTKSKRWGCGDLAFASGNARSQQATESSALFTLFLLALPAGFVFCAAQRRTIQQNIRVRAKDSFKRD